MAVCALLTLVSCVYDDIPVPHEWVRDDSPVVILHISTLDAGSDSKATVKERVKSLRIIMLHKNPTNSKTYIELNEFVDFSEGGDVAANTFRYIFSKRTVPGEKMFYLIANEESVPEIHSSLLPAAVSDASLSEFMEFFKPNMPGNNQGDEAEESENDGSGDEADSGDGAEDDTVVGPTEKEYDDFVNILNSISFNPDFSDFNDLLGYRDASGSGENSADRTIYLPYSAFYDNFVVAEEAGEYSRQLPMCLVPVATKFSFKFINERTAQNVAVDYIAIESANKANYLMANVGSSELTKNFGTESYYWIDWLRRIAEESQNNVEQDDNVYMNNRYGWIREYEVPEKDAEPHYFVPDGGADMTEVPFKSTSLILPVATEDKSGKVTSTTTEIGPFYLPESRNMVKEEDPEKQGILEGDEQDDEAELVEQYTLKLKMRDENIKVDDPSLVKVMRAETKLSNLKSLFRSTSMLITITLREGGVNIYGETVPWNKKVFYGYVKDEDEIK